MAERDGHVKLAKCIGLPSVFGTGNAASTVRVRVALSSGTSRQKAPLTCAVVRPGHENAVDEAFRDGDVPIGSRIGGHGGTGSRETG